MTFRTTFYLENTGRELHWSETYGLVRLHDLLSLPVQGRVQVISVASMREGGATLQCVHVRLLAA